MTRRGSLVYYLTAIVVGCLFMAVAILAVAQITTPRWDFGRDLFLFYFLAISHGWLPALLYALLLRRVNGALRWNRSWQWMVSGGSVAILVIIAWLFIPADWVGARFVMRSLLWLLPSGNMVISYGFTSSLKVLLPTIFLGGGATAFVLHRIHRAFEPQPEPSAFTEKPGV